MFHFQNYKLFDVARKYETVKAHLKLKRKSNSRDGCFVNNLFQVISNFSKTI